jgi:hypothetical protein
VTGPYCTWRTCRNPAVIIHRGQSGTGDTLLITEGGACTRHDRNVHDRCAQAGPVTSRIVEPVNETATQEQNQLF